MEIEVLIFYLVKGRYYNMKKYIELLVVILSSASILLACSNGDSTNQGTANEAVDNTVAATTSRISGSAIKGPISGAEMKLYFLDEDGTETEIVAENAPVLTSTTGGFDFQVDSRKLESIQTPMVLRSIGGTMGGGPAPVLETLVTDPAQLAIAGQALTRHLSTASSVAARLFKTRAKASTSSLDKQNAEDCFAKVEEELDVDLDQDPADAAQAVAMLNLNVDENLDLFNFPQNNEAVEEYIEYLARNLNSSSGMLDDKMDDPENPGEDMEADFPWLGDGHLSRACPQGPSRFLNLMVKVDKPTILNDGVDFATVDLKLTNGWGRRIKDRSQIDLMIVEGVGDLSDTSPTIRRGRARVTFTSTTVGRVVIEASYSLDNGNTIAQMIAVEVVDDQVNSAPIADAGTDQNVPTGSVVTLDGSQSSDTNNDQLTYTWVLATPGGSAATLSDPTVFNPTFTADVDGIYIAELVVNDGTQDSVPAAVTNTAASGNVTPTADAGADQNVTTGTNVSLDGSGSRDADSDPLTFVWTLVSVPSGSSATLSGSNRSNPTFIADVDGIYVAELVVNDGSIDSAPATATITASSANSAPTANAGSNQNVATGSIVALDGSGSRDADNDLLTYQWTIVSKPAGSSAGLNSVNQPNPTFTADVDGTYVVELIVNDGAVDSVPATVEIRAATANSAPTADAGPNQIANTGTTVVLDGTGSSDADNDPLTFNWTIVSTPAGSAAALQNPAKTEMVFLTPDVAGTYTVQLVVNDGTVDSAPAAVTITATAAGPDGAAIFSANCASCHGADGTQIFNLRGLSAARIESTLPHQGVTLTDIGGTAGAQAMADFLSQ